MRGTVLQTRYSRGILLRLQKPCHAMGMHMLLRLYFGHSLRSIQPCQHDRRRLSCAQYNAKLSIIGQWLTDLQRLQRLLCLNLSDFPEVAWPVGFGIMLVMHDLYPSPQKSTLSTLDAQNPA